jgi:hypothetical protein
MTYRDIIEEIKKEINLTLNKFKLFGEYNIIFEIERILEIYLKKKYIYDFKVDYNCNSEWHDVKIYIQITKRSEIIEIIPERFTRYKKLKKLKN